MQQDLAEPGGFNGATTATAGGLTSRLRSLASDLCERYGTFLRYALVGASGYVVYLGFLETVYDAQLFSFLPRKNESIDLGFFTHNDSLFLLTTIAGTQASIVAVFIGHTLWTFADAGTARKPLWQRFAQFEARALVSTLGILTVTVNAALLAGVHPYIAVPFGLVLTFAWNWLWDSKVVWRKDHTNDAPAQD